MNTASDTAHHSLAAHEVVLILETDALKGLSPQEAATRKGVFGPNVLPRPQGAGFLRSLIHQVNDPLIYVLLAAVAVTLLLAEYVDALVISVVVIVNLAIGLLQESRAEAVAILMGWTLPILPTQILWINMTTAVALGLMLAFEPKEPGLMSRPPRDPDRPLFTRQLGLRVLLVSALLVGGTWWTFQGELGRGASLPEARTAALNLFVAFQILYLFSCRSLGHPAWTVKPFSNRWLAVGVLLQVLAQAAITYLPAMNTLFHTAPLDLQSWLAVFLAAAAAWGVVALDKHFRPNIT
ncbi:cation transporting ATPase C-terminal domain-containing protein [Paenarthrobacter ureafaciens]|uniref:cation transporting ATPase C-terminal domain-containing protein n=1 Tax=Paenarthrobacter ureafaciens TaxID=37931 RepID=UPI001FB5669C|nr:cation transporting ATPase C-terminal domain-containing protein [Paenarthrobacter ureafaciens]UOD82941.1 cation transporting ATPase C-terminal domain-containing protein [Paenarthrobacter ureafaciens]WNZ02648.1 cation transporting ATPase C-terminal domain-containing protein [Paenarthrobacter ureafaciens]